MGLVFSIHYVLIIPFSQRQSPFAFPKSTHYHGASTMSTSIQALLASVRASSTLSTPQKRDIDALLSAIEAGLAPLAAQDPEGHASLLNFLACAMHESTRKERTSVIAMAARKGMLLSFRPLRRRLPRSHRQRLQLGKRPVVAGRLTKIGAPGP
jgi:hypothetical protein